MPLSELHRHRTGDEESECTCREIPRIELRLLSLTESSLTILLLIDRVSQRKPEKIGVRIVYKRRSAT